MPAALVSVCLRVFVTVGAQAACLVAMSLDVPAAAVLQMQLHTVPGADAFSAGGRAAPKAPCLRHDAILPHAFSLLTVRVAVLCCVGHRYGLMHRFDTQQERLWTHRVEQVQLLHCEALLQVLLYAHVSALRTSHAPRQTLQSVQRLMDQHGVDSTVQMAQETVARRKHHSQLIAAVTLQLRRCERCSMTTSRVHGARGGESLAPLADQLRVNTLRQWLWLHFAV